LRAVSAAAKWAKRAPIGDRLDALLPGPLEVVHERERAQRERLREVLEDLIEEEDEDAR
jgi:hypothetical protein